MADQEQLEILKQGVDVWNRWREEHPEVEEPDLSEAYLPNANLTQANLTKANLQGACLQGANLTFADLRSAFLSLADLRGADLQRACLQWANLTFADLQGADLQRVILTRADLFQAVVRGANLTFAELRGADLQRADLRGAVLQRAILIEANLTQANLTQANLTGTSLTEASLVRTNIDQATLTGCHIYGISVWDLQGIPENQSNLVITQYGEPTVTVDDLEVAQFIHLLLNHKKLRNVLNSVTERGVLLLGRFGGGGITILQAIADKLRDLGYLPIIFDFDKPDDRDYTETVKTLAGLSRFVIVDLSGPSVPQELYATVPHLDIPFVPILEHSSKPHSMFIDFLKYPWMLRPIVTYQSIDQLIEFLPEKVIMPAEERAKARQALVHQLFDSV